MVTDVVDGDSLEAALRDYGPAAIEDLLPRLRAIALTLDRAHAAGEVHGALHPLNIFVSADATRVTGLGESSDPPIRLPYSAPELVAGGAPQPAADQFALAAIAFEWMFGRRISGPAERPVEVRTLPGVDRDAMSQAFTRALAPQPADRYPSCTAFSDALAGSVVPVLPLGAADDQHDDVMGAAILHEVDERIEAPLFAAEEPVSRDPVFEEPVIEEPRFTPIEARLSPPVEPVTSWQPSATYTPAKPADRFSGGMLIAACLVGMVVGFAAGYMARPRALQSGMVSGASGASGASGVAGVAGAAAPGTEANVSPPPVPPPPPPSSTTPASKAPAAPAPRAPQAVAPLPTGNIGRLLVRSTPGGASVTVDGVARGVTPLALRDLELGSRTVAIARGGYISEEQRVVLTAARPSRSLEVRLTPAAAPRSAPGAAARPAAPAPGQRPAAAPAATGGLVIESRPPGATVMIDGQPRGTTPVTIDGLAPADYRVNLSLAGYQPFAATVRVVAGQRTRTAASLSVQE